MRGKKKRHEITIFDKNTKNKAQFSTLLDWATPMEIS